MKVSVIVPMHNAEDTIDRLYQSLARSEYKNLEIIFVDNVSTDRSFEKVKYYQIVDSRIKVVSEERFGVSYARRRGFQEATGEYVYFIDADDYVTPNGIKDMVQAAEMENADMVRGNYYILYDDNVSRVLDMCSDLNPLFLKQFDGPSTQSFENQNIPLWGALYKKSLIKDHYFVNLQQGEDNLFNLYAYADAKKVVDISSYIYIYIRHKKGLSMAPSLTDAYRLLNEYGKIAMDYAGKEILESHQIQLEQRIINNYLVLYNIEYVDAMKRFMNGEPCQRNQQRLQDMYEILKAMKPYSNPRVRLDESNVECLKRMNLLDDIEYQEVRGKQFTLK